ncbi:MAG: hypothetical protein SFU56_01170 [Capsulimonadales bacterium]|nr:hypothetical protein [Capsulimonadales bacterium]
MSVFPDIRRLPLDEKLIDGLVRSSRVRRIVISLLSDGEVPFSSSKLPFAQMSVYRDRPAQISALIEAAHRRGIAVYGYADLVRWGAPGVVEGGVLTAHPEWCERVPGGGYGLLTQGRYVSLFHPEARRVLGDFFQEVYARYPDLDGFVLSLRYPTEYLCGFSPASRQAMIRGVQIDPEDLLVGPNDFTQDILTELARWRFATAREFLKSVMVRAFDRPTRRIALAGDPEIYRSPLKTRSRSLNDWLSWTDLPGVKEVIFFPKAASASPKPQTFSYARTLLQKSGNAVTATGAIRWTDSAKLTGTALTGYVPAGMDTLVEISRPGDLIRLP